MSRPEISPRRVISVSWRCGLAGDRIQLQQVFLNLMIKAIEAMNGISDAPRDLLIHSA
jgi:C4-dicarboxylate-specific signal transduction histidine kinase